jgi:2',3'-cyclic-nucleotide 2'-phosphodiesterase (5'-nucleotidase family)
MHWLALLVPVMAVWCLGACNGCRSTPSSQARAIPPSDAAPTVRLYLVTDLAGALEPCGCTKDQLGGLDHFGAWVASRRSHVPVAFVAASGPLFFMDEKLETERADQDRQKAFTLARVLRGLDFLAFAPGANDWADGSETLAKLASEAGAVPIVANADASAAASVVVRDVVGADGGVLKVGFVGYGQPLPGGSPPANVEDVVRRGVERAKASGANVLIALAAVGRGEAKRIADAIPELTAVVVGSRSSSGDANRRAPEGERVGDVLVVEASNHLQSAAVLDLYVRESVTAGQLVKFADATGLELARRREDLTGRIDDLHVKIAAWERDKSVLDTDLQARRQDLAELEHEREALDAKPPPASGSFFRYAIEEIRDSLGKDPAIDAQLAGYYAAVDEHNRAAFKDRLPPPAGPSQASYIGIEACTKCHEGPRAVWDRTPHARAYATLATQFKEFNLECVGCHVTGYEKPGGSAVVHVDKLTNVQCEVCHGPGSRHALDPGDKSLIVGRPSPSMCLDCHHSPHVEQFDPVAKLAGVLGPGHGMPKLPP